MDELVGHSVEGWSIVGPRDNQLVRPDWTSADPVRVDGIVVHPITNVLTDDGVLTEIWRSEWDVGGQGVGQVFQRQLLAGSCSGWHAHSMTTDRLFCADGRLRISLFDARVASPTHGASMAVRLGAHRPAIVVVPPGVWHAVRNIGGVVATLVNVVDAAYDYEEPDHFRLPADSDQIPISP